MDEPIVEWLEQVEMICELSDKERVERILPLRLKDGTLTVYWQLTKERRADIEEIKYALTTAFALYVFVAFDQFTMLRLCDGETVDKFLATLKRLALQVGEMPPEKWIACMFVAGLPQPVRQQLQALAQMDTMTLDLLHARAWAILVENHNSIDPIVATVQRPHTDAVEPTADQSGGNLVCYLCTNPNPLGNGYVQGHATRMNHRVRRLCQRL